MRNENTRHPNRHTLYMAETGHGKSHCMAKFSGIPASGARLVLFDPNRDHKAHRFETRSGFARALAAANASGRGFRIAYTGPAGPKNFEWWCACVAAILDGDKLTFAIIEEYSGQSATAGLINPAREPWHSALWLQGRKYGLVIHAATQRPQRISKDALENAGAIFAGAMGSRARKSVAEETDIDPSQFTNLKVGEFLHWQRGRGHKLVRVFS